MKSTFCFVLLLSIIGISQPLFSQKTTQSTKLYIQTTDVSGTGKSQIKKETVSVVTSDYFEVSLYSYKPEAGESKYYKAKRDLIEPTSTKNYKAKFFFIVKDSKGTEKRFTDSTDFLNFMSSHGYKMVDQTKNKFHTDYTFQKK
jgi:hypothetical protein